MREAIGAVIVVAALVLFCGGVNSERAEASSERWQDRFSDQAVLLAPPRLPDGLNVGDLFAEWGIRFSNENGSPPVSHFLLTSPALNAEPPYPWTTAIVNSAVEPAEVGKFVIHLNRPLRRVTLRMGAESWSPAKATAFGKDGTVVDEMNWWVNQIPDLFILEEDEGQWIYRIEVEIDEPAFAHRLYLILADFVDPPTFLRCIPQIAHGALPDGRTLQTLVVMTNPEPLNIFGLQPTPEISLDFFDSAGAPLPVALNGEISSQVTGTLAPRESKVFATTEAVSASGLDAGYACLTSNYPLELAAVFRVLDEDGGVVAEAGIDGQRPGHRFVGLLEKDPIEETNTALALANVSESEMTAAVSFFLAPNTTFSAEVVLGPGEHGSWFADELSSQLADRDAVGTVKILSDQPIVGTILRTIRGVVSASLPLNRQRAADEE